jgi:hypothetical protein
MRNVHKILVIKPEWKILLWRLMRRWEDNINMNLTAEVCEGVDLIHPTQDSSQCRPLCVWVCFVLVFCPLCVLWFVSSCVTNCHLCFFWILVFRCVCVCVCVCPRARIPRFVCNSCVSWFFCVLWFVQWLCHLLPPVLYWLQGFMCVCAQVGCSVVCNWSLRDLFVDVCILVYLGFIFFYNF